MTRSWDAFFPVWVRQFTAVIPAGVQYDELRVDTTWSGVTSHLVPEPASVATLGLAAAGLLIRRPRRRGHA